MGLDNGLILYTRAPINVPPEIRKLITVTTHEGWDYSCEYELLYFRKCWNIRSAVGRVLGASPDYCGKSGLDIDEVKSIWWVIKQLNNKYLWEHGTWSSIWTYEEIKDRLDNSLLILEWLIHFMREHRYVGANEDYVVEFYDSY